MKTVIAFLLLLPTIAVAQSEPNLEATVNFMNQMVKPEGREIDLVSNCEVAITTFHKAQIWLYSPSHKGFLTVDDTGINTEPGVLPFPRYTRFNLADIDPATVESRSGGFSDGYVKRFYEEHPGICKTYDDKCEAEMLSFFDQKFEDVTAASYGTVDHKPAIARGVMTKIENPADPRNLAGYTAYSYTAKAHVDKTGFSFADQDRAQRFVTALVHAVSLCGGHGSMFAPTPGKKW